MNFRFAFSAAFLLASVSALPASILDILARAEGQVVSGNAATPSTNDNDGIGRGADSYTFFQGNGSPDAGWPRKDQWASFGDLFEANKELMSQSCANNNWGANNSEQEIAGMRTAINKIAEETKVDHRLVLAIIMQESIGCVRVITTPNPDPNISNPGLMQSHSGSTSCNGKEPCPADQITSMIREGTAGTPAGDGLAAVLNTVQPDLGGSGDARTFYSAARKYNSGSVDYENLNNGFSSTPCYASDVANRLTGWTLAPKQCNL